MKKLFFTICFLLEAVLMNAQMPNEVTLVVSGEGTSKEEAINQALRSAIEQAFGVFVSANTEILNDEIVKDEIATVTSGNIKSFKELAFIETVSGTKSITIEATVAVGKLIEYSKSHGSKAEFAGAVFGANIRLRELNKKNEELVISHFLEGIEAERVFNISVYLPEEPFLGDVVFSDSGYKLSSDQHDAGFYNIKNSHYAIPVILAYASPMEEKQGYNLLTVLTYSLSEYGYSVWDNLQKILSSISLTPDEMSGYETNNQIYYNVYLGKHSFHLRSSKTARLIYGLSVTMHDAMFAGWRLVVSKLDGTVNYSLKAPYYYHKATAVKTVESFTQPTSGEDEFLLFYGSDYSKLYLRSHPNYDWNYDQIDDTIAKRIIEDRCNITEWKKKEGEIKYIPLSWDLLRNRPIVESRFIPSRDEGEIKSSLSLIPSKKDERIIISYYAGRNPFSLSLEDHYHIDRIERKVMDYHFDSFVFDCLDWDSYKNNSLNVVRFYLPFTEEEIQNISSIEISYDSINEN